MKKTSLPGIIVAAIWLLLTLLAWLSPREEISLSERRTLAQTPVVSADSLASGQFMEDFEDFTLDQFPLRDSFRSIKALFSRYVLQQQDNSGIYVSDGYAAELCYPLDEASVNHALKQFQLVYEICLDDSNRIYSTVVPDKSYYLAEASGHLAMDHQALFDLVKTGMPWASYVDITQSLTLENYYRTDTHWKQEALLPVAQTLSGALGVTISGDYTATALERPFFGVYYGQAALPMEPETMYILENELLSDCRVYNFVTDSYTDIYDMEKLDAYDQYDVFLSGAQSLLRIENPNAGTDRELIVFRDSFGSSLTPLLIQDYAAITLIDIRYIAPQVLDKYVDFTGRDVLFMYSSLVLNKNLI